MENTTMVLQKVELDPANPASGSVSKGFESRISKRSLYTFVCNSITHYSQKVEATQVSINGWMDKQKMVCTYKGILFSLKKEGSSEVCCSMDGAWGHYAKWNKPIIKRQILRDPAYMRESQFSHSVMSNSLWPHGLQHARLLCPSPTPGAYSNSCSSRRWGHPTISSSVFTFSSILLSFPASRSFSASGSFPISVLFTSGGQGIGALASASFLPMTIQGWFLLGLPGWTSLLSKGLSTVFSNSTVWKHQFFCSQPS